MDVISARNPSESAKFVRTLCDDEPGRPAILATDGGSVTYEALFHQLISWAAALHEVGLQPGDRVVTVLPESPRTAQLMLALAGVVTCCPLDPMLPEEEYGRRIGLVQPAAIMVAEGRSHRVRNEAASVGVAIIDVSDDPAARIAQLDGPVVRPPGAEALPPGLLLATSGSTGEAKLAVIPWPVMLDGARASVHAYQLTPRDRRLNVMPLFHIQGLVGSVLASLAAGGSVVCAPGFDPAAVTRSWLRHDVTWFSASPAMHQQILDAADPGWRPEPSLRFARCGSAGLPGSLRAQLKRFYRVPIIESYGMTEAHQIASTPLPPRTALGMVPTGSEIAIEVRPGVITAEPGRRGQILARGDNVIPGYIPADPEAFTGGWLRTGDQGELAEDGSLRITGRIRELIIRGGENIAPREIEEVLRAHPAVRDVCVAGVPDPVLGERVAAAVTLAAPDRADPGTLRSFAAAQLAPFKVPEIIVAFGELPVTGPGKLARATIARQLAAVSTATAGTAPAGAGAAAPSFSVASGPREASIAVAVLALWRQALRDDSVGPDDDFYAAGGDSLAATTMLAAVGEHFGVPISPLEMFDEASTAAAMAAYIEARSGVGVGPGRSGG
jgi:oxalate---CoA ligase